MAASSVAGPDSVAVSSSSFWPRLLKAGASSISFDHLERSDLQLLLSARGQAIDGTNDCLLKRLQASILESHGASWASQQLGSTAPSRELGAVIIHNGDIYMFSGTLAESQEPPLSELLMKFEPSTGRFEGIDMRVEDESDDEEDSLLDSYPMPVSGAATLVHDDKLWVFGGLTAMENGDTCNHMWAYDFFARHWSLIDQKGAIPAERARACTVLHDGKMLLYGYQEDEVEKEDGRTIPVFDFSTYTWSRMTTTGTSPANQTYVDGLAMMEDAFMYTLVQPYDTPHATALVYRLDLQKKRWSKVKVSGKAPEVRADCAVGQLNDFIVVNGGCFREDAADPDSWQEDRSSNDTWIFSLTKHEWQQLDAGGLVPRARHHAVAFHDSMLLIGGEMTNAEADDDSDEDPSHRLLGPIQAIHMQPKVPRPKDSAGLANIDLSTKLRGFYQSPAHADIQLRAGSEVFPAHKIVLAAQSPTFERMFESGMVEQTSREVSIEGMQPAVLKALLAYMYGCLSDIEPGMVHDLFRAADHYQVEGLRGELLELMITNIDTENAAAFALLADDYGITALHDASVTFASTTSNKLAVAGSESFLKLMTARPQLAQKFITGVMASEDMPSKRSATKLGKRKRK